MIDGVKTIQKHIETVRAGQSKDFGKALQPIAMKLVDFVKRVLVFSENLENLGRRILENGEDLHEKEKFPQELKAKTDIQGKRLESIGSKLQKIGNNCEVIGDKMDSIGNRIGGDDGSKLTNLSNRVKDKGAVIQELGIKIQHLEPNVRHVGTDADLEDMLKALMEIVRELQVIMKVILCLQIIYTH